MTELESALDRVVEAARAHLHAVTTEGGDEVVLAAYVALNNAAYAYDSLLNEIHGEVTPWELEEINDTDDPDSSLSLVSTSLRAADDPHPLVVSVRQRRDYRVPSVAALLRAAQEARGGGDPIDTVAEAVVELLSCGDGSLAMLDVPALDPLDGVVVVVEAASPLDPDAHPEEDAEAPFRLDAGERIVSRVDERMTDVRAAGGG